MNDIKIKIVQSVADPPILSAEILAQIEAASVRLCNAFRTATKSMEILTANDFKIRIE
jgi:hypothetical protein